MTAAVLYCRRSPLGRRCDRDRLVLRSRRSCRGFSLLEMLIVVAILAALTVVAVQSLEPVELQARHAASLKTLQAVRDAIVHCEDNVVAGFIADTGRLPTQIADLTGTNDGGATIGPADLPEYEPLQIAVGPNWGGSSWSVTAGSTGAILHRGWRGPYLLPGANGVVADGWGYPLAAYPPEFPPLATTAGGITLGLRGSATLMTGGLLTQAVPTNQYSAVQLSGGVYSPTDDAGPWCVMLVAPGTIAEGGFVVYCVTAAPTGLSSPQPVATYSFTPGADDFRGIDLDARVLLVGPRLLGAAKGDSSSADRTGNLQNIVVRPGAQTYDVFVP